MTEPLPRDVGGCLHTEEACDICQRLWSYENLLATISDNTEDWANCSLSQALWKLGAIHDLTQFAVVLREERRKAKDKS
jgi:hypothetical protein